MQRRPKHLGRKVQNFDDEVEGEFPSLVTDGNDAKFGQNEELQDFLPEPVKRFSMEASPYDCIWGIGLKATDERAEHPG